MKHNIFAICCTLLGVATLLTRTSSAAIHLSFDSSNCRAKSPRTVPTLCRLKSLKSEMTFPYSGSEDIAKRILCGENVGQVIALSVVEYPSGNDVVNLFALLNLGKVFAFPGEIRAQTSSPFNALHAGGLDWFAILPFAESRARYRCDCFKSKRPFHSHEVNPTYDNEHVFKGYALRDACVSNAVIRCLKVVEARDSLFFPEMDCLVVCDPVDGVKVLAVCYFVGGEQFPFEGCGRGLPVELRDITRVSFVKIEPEVLLEREFGPGFVGLSGDELVSRILALPRKDRALELINLDIVENKFGRWNLIGSTGGRVSCDGVSKGEYHCFYIYALDDKKLVVVTCEKRALCVWKILDDFFWRLFE